MKKIKKTRERYQNLSKKTKKTPTTWSWTLQKSKMKNKSLLSIEKNIIEWEKMFYYKKVF